MTAIISCITLQHDLRFVALAAVICALGCWITIRLYRTAAATTGLPRVGWLFMDAVAAGSAIWTTHFVAMLAFDPGVPTSFDAERTMQSLLVAIAGTFVGLTLSFAPIPRAGEIGGALVGLATAAMHYLGMSAYRVDGLVDYDPTYLATSIGLAAVLGAAAFNRARRFDAVWSQHAAVVLLLLAIVSLHFTGMTAVSVTPWTSAWCSTRPAPWGSPSPASAFSCSARPSRPTRSTAPIATRTRPGSAASPMRRRRASPWSRTAASAPPTGRSRSS